MSVRGGEGSRGPSLTKDSRIKTEKELRHTYFRTVYIGKLTPKKVIRIRRKT